MQVPQQQQDLLKIFQSTKKVPVHALMEYADVIGEKLVLDPQQAKYLGIPYDVKDDLFQVVKDKQQNYPSKPNHVEEEIGEFLDEIPHLDEKTKLEAAGLLKNNPITLDLHRKVMALIGWPFADLQMFMDYWILKVRGRLNAQADGIDRSVRKQILNPYEEALGAYTFGRKYDAMA